MKKILSAVLFLLLLSLNTYAQESKVKYPWDNGRLKVSDNQRYLVHENGVPFFWLGDTGWLASSRLNRDGMSYYFNACKKNGFNVVQVSVLHEIPFYNIYGKPALPNGFDFRKVDVPGEYGYWDHIDYMVNEAAKNGIYIGIVCVWGGNVSSGRLSEQDAVKYGSFLANRYKDKPNIIWIIGGDTKGNARQEVWLALARTIKSIDHNHLMTYHPRGRMCSADWFNNESWLDFNMFQSGHRRYGQRNGDGEYPIEENTEEDNWRFVEKTYALTPKKPVLDGEPSYEDIPAGLHDFTERHWQAEDVRRYAYWSVFAGSFGHTYGHNSIMQMLTPGVIPSYDAKKYWYEALEDPGYRQMKFLKKLMTALPYTQGIPDQSVISGDAGQKHDRLIATRGNDYALVYSYTGKEIKIDLDKISGDSKNIWWYNPSDGNLLFVETVKSGIRSYIPEGGYRSGNDKVLIAIDADKSYIQKEWKFIPSDK
jgi:hypothetical protein